MKKINDKGFTLIEMLISVLITGVMMLGVTAFINSSRVSYTKVTTSVSLQEEAGITTKFLNEIVVESSEWGQYSGLSYTDSSDSSKTSDMLVIWFKALDDSKEDVSDRSECYYFIIWEKDMQCIRYAKFPVTEIDKTSLLGDTNDYLTDLLADYFFDDYSLISRYAKSFSITPDPDNMRRYSIDIVFTYNGENYEAHVNSVSRNE